MVPRTMPPYYVYILRCADGTLYTGSTNDLAARESKHNTGRGAKYTASRRPVRVVYSEAHESRSAAQKREAQLKTWSRANKEALIRPESRTAGCPRPKIGHPDLAAAGITSSRHHFLHKPFGGPNSWGRYAPSSTSRKRRVPLSHSW
jgi:putative endonuclease